LLILLAGTLSAQQAPPAASQPSTAQAAPGTVTGRVFCQDTGQPGRFASVQLVSDNAATNRIFDAASIGKKFDPERDMAKVIDLAKKGKNLSTVTGLDGAFTLDKVPPGTYYVLAQLAGYQSPLRQFSQPEVVTADPAALAAVESSSPKIVVQSGQPIHADIQLERGASIGGTIHYDDGSPAPGVAPELMVLGKDGKWKELSSTGSAVPVGSDDRGHYRAYGLAAGKYAVKATLIPTGLNAMNGLGGSSPAQMNFGDALVVYSGGAMWEKDIKPVEVGPGADVEGVDLIFPLDNLHSVSGSVVAKFDGHAVDTGNVALLDPDTKAEYRGAMIHPDGAFRMNNIPEGQYLLKVMGAADTDSAGSTEFDNDYLRMVRSKELKSYGEAEQSVTIKNDLSGLVMQVPDKAAAPVAVPKPPATPPAPSNP